MLANTTDLAMIVIYNHNHSFIVMATVIMIVNYDHKTFIVQDTGSCYIFLNSSEVSHTAEKHKPIGAYCSPLKLKRYL